MTDTPNRPPLWEVLQGAYFQGRNPGLSERHGYAAEIRAVADWLIPDDPVPDVVLESDLEAFTIYMAFNRIRMHLRQQLLDEADRAERGEVEP